MIGSSETQAIIRFGVAVMQMLFLEIQDRTRFTVKTGKISLMVVRVKIGSLVGITVIRSMQVVVILQMEKRVMIRSLSVNMLIM